MDNTSKSRTDTSTNTNTDTNTITNPISRRSFSKNALVAGGIALGTLTFGGSVMSGCSNAQNTSSNSRTGFASGTEVKDYPVTLRVIADSNLEWHAGGSAAAAKAGATDKNHLEEYFVRYKTQDGRDQVSFEVEYVEPGKLNEMANSGFGGGDVVIGTEATLNAGNEAGKIDGGSGGYQIIDISSNFTEKCVMVRARGSKAELPAAKTIDGNDSQDGSVSRIQRLPEYDGLIAIANPDVATEGICANQMLAKQNFYSSYDGKSGEYSNDVKSKIRTYDSQDAAINAVVSGECQLGFAFENSLSVRYPHTSARYTKVEKCYSPSGGNVKYMGSAIAGSAEPGVARDFLVFITKCSD